MVCDGHTKAAHQFQVLSFLQNKFDNLDVMVVCNGHTKASTQFPFFVALVGPQRGNWHCKSVLSSSNFIGENG